MILDTGAQRCHVHTHLVLHTALDSRTIFNTRILPVDRERYYYYRCKIRMTYVFYIYIYKNKVFSLFLGSFSRLHFIFQHCIQNGLGKFNINLCAVTMIVTGRQISPGFLIITVGINGMLIQLIGFGKISIGT